MAFRIVAILCALGSAAGAQFSADPDTPGALVVFPLVRVDTAGGLDTFLRLGNSASQTTDLRCFYENTTAHCSISGDVCTVDADCPVGSICLPGWTINDFSIRLGPGQPVEWRASEGLAALPGPSNQGIILAVAEDPFVGALRCVVVDDLTGLPPTPGGAEDDSIEGVATIERAGAQTLELARYRAIGFPNNSSDGDVSLRLGEEYEACPNVVILSHLFENSVDPVRGDTTIGTDLALVPCGADYATQTPFAGAVHFNIYNEFGQRTGVSARLGPQLFAPLARIHPTVFDVGVQGALAGQTRIEGGGGGVVGVAIRALLDGDARVATQASGLHHQGARVLDEITLPGP